MARIITIEPFVPPEEIHIDTTTPSTIRKYGIENNVVSSLEKFNDIGEKKGIISSEKISMIKPEFDGKLPEYKGKITLKSIFHKLGILNGKLSKDEKFKDLIVHPSELKKLLENLELENQANEMEELLKNTNIIIEEKNQKIEELEKQLIELKRENQALKTVNQLLIDGDKEEIENLEREKVR